MKNLKSLKGNKLKKESLTKVMGGDIYIDDQIKRNKALDLHVTNSYSMPVSESIGGNDASTSGIPGYQTNIDK